MKRHTHTADKERKRAKESTDTRRDNPLTILYAQAFGMVIGFDLITRRPCWYFDTVDISRLPGRHCQKKEDAIVWKIEAETRPKKGYFPQEKRYIPQKQPYKYLRATFWRAEVANLRRAEENMMNQTNESCFFSDLCPHQTRESNESTRDKPSSTKKNEAVSPWRKNQSNDKKFHSWNWIQNSEKPVKFVVSPPENMAKFWNSEAELNPATDWGNMK